MVEIKIKEKTYEVPTEWKDITLRYWCGLYNILKKYNKGEDGDLNVEQKQQHLQSLRMNKEIFMYITGLQEAEMEELDVESVTKAVATVSSLFKEYKSKGIDRFELEDEVYFFPKEFLKQNTFGDYIESTHLDSTIEIMKHGVYDVLPEQMAILCRKHNEEYDDDVIPEKTEKFKDLTMDIVWEFSFFLQIRSVRLTRIFQTFLGKTPEEVEVEKIKFLQLDSTENL